MAISFVYLTSAGEYWQSAILHKRGIMQFSFVVWITMAVTFVMNPILFVVTSSLSGKVTKYTYMYIGRQAGITLFNLQWIIRSVRWVRNVNVKSVSRLSRKASATGEKAEHA